MIYGTEYPGIYYHASHSGHAPVFLASNKEYYYGSKTEKYEFKTWWKPWFKAQLCGSKVLVRWDDE